MPLINIEYDNEKLSDDEAESLSKAVRDIVSGATGIEDVFVYSNTAHIKVQIAPIEIFVRMTASKIENVDGLTQSIKEALSKWKTEQDFQHPINLTLIPMTWRVEIDI